MDVRIFPPEDIVEATVLLPLSKSMSARALVINHIGGFTPEGLELSDSEDTAAIAAGLGVVTGTHNVGPAGTAMRFLTAVYAATPGVDTVLDGNERMRQRPVGPLVEALRALGADIEYLEAEGYAPLRIRGRRLSGGEIRIDSSISSQFISALMMVSPLMEHPLTLTFDGEPSSLSYIKMTASMMERAGVSVERTFGRISVDEGMYVRPIDSVERDWSAASYWYAITAVSAGWITLRDMSTDSIQGDVAMAGIGERIGVVTAPSEDEENAIELSANPDLFSRLDLDMSDTPDLVQTIVVVAVTLGIPFRLTGVASLRIKETDRLAALAAEMDKLGVKLEIDGDRSIAWDGRRHPIFEVPTFDTYGDHRMAMSLVPVAIFLPGIVIRDYEVTGKSYPGFWDDIRNAGFTLLDAAQPLDQTPAEEE